MSPAPDHFTSPEEIPAGSTAIVTDGPAEAVLNSPKRRFPVAGIGVDALTREQLLADVARATDAREKCRVVFCNTSSIVEASHRAPLFEAINGAEIVSPDGMPLVWLGKLRGIGRGIERVDGPSFMKEAMRYGVAFGWRHYLYGSTPAVLDSLKSRMQAEIPGIQIVGMASPAFGEQSQEQVDLELAEINASAADLVWIGLGMPKQELWMARYGSRVESPVLLGVGAAFDFQAGHKARAPRWMQRTGMEWLHRLIQEPRRLWRRYLIGSVEFGFLVLRSSLPGSGAR